MDKSVIYRELIKKVLKEYETLFNTPSPLPDQVDDHALFDEKHDRYMLFRTGWWEKQRINSATLYIRLHNNKIYIEEDWTEDGIATDLLQAGVPREDIVLAFHPPEMRQYTEFAAS